MSTVPTAADCATYCGKPSNDAKVADARLAEIAAQAAVCRVEPYTDDLAQALKRRVARNLALRGVPLNVQDSQFGGSTFVGGRDPEVRRLEAPYRKLVKG